MTSPRETTFDFTAEIKRRQKLVDERLSSYIDTADVGDENLRAAMRYSLTSGGKRLRPLLIFAAADAISADGEQYMNSALAIEMIHTYSLIHDDLPALDNDDLRRGKPTNHKAYGEATAILAGDALLTMAFSLLTRENTSPEICRQIIREIADAAGAGGMVGGQALDMAAENKQISLEELKKLHLGKTGALIRAAVRVGAILAAADAKELAALTSYAENLGLAFQITDDILDAVGDTAILGKPTGSDEKNHKSTYVSLVGIDQARQLAQDAVTRALAALCDFDGKAAFLRCLANMILTRQK